MPVIKKKHIRKSRRRVLIDTSNTIVVMHTIEKDTLFPEKLKMVNKMLSKTKFLDSKK